MTKHEAYLKQKPITKGVIGSINLALHRSVKGDYNSQNDKAEFRFTLDDKSLELGYGYYGSSSYYRTGNESTTAYIQRACNEMKAMIGDKAIQLAEDDLEKLRLEAVEEATLVLGEIAPLAPASQARG